jgi:uncharacterized protein
MIVEGKLCKSIFSQTLGLMFSRQKNLVFEFKKEKRISLHMFFVFYPIDLVFLDSNKKVVELKSNFRPFRTYMPRNKSKYILELRKGLIIDNEIKIGDKISFEK